MLKPAIFILFSLFFMLGADIPESGNKPEALIKLKAVVNGTTKSKGRSYQQKGLLFYSFRKILVAQYVMPSEYLIVIDSVGKQFIYYPVENTVSRLLDPWLGSGMGYFHCFLTNRTKDFGLKRMGFTFLGKKEKGGAVVFSFLPPAHAVGTLSKVEITLRKEIPTGIRYIGPNGKLRKRVSFDKGRIVEGIWLPENTTSVSYFSEKDSSVEKSVYSNYILNQSEEGDLFDFEIPENAKQMN